LGPEVDRKQLDQADIDLELTNIVQGNMNPQVHCHNKCSEKSLPTYYNPKDDVKVMGGHGQTMHKSFFQLLPQKGEAEKKSRFQVSASQGPLESRKS
jgi:hypothetical protein